MKQLQILWAAMIGGVLVYAAVAYSLIVLGGIEFHAFDPAIMSVLGGVVLAWMVAALGVRRVMLARIPRDLPPEERRPRYLSTIVVVLALIEGGGLLMITFGMLVGAESWILVGGAAAAVFMVLARPTADAS